MSPPPANAGTLRADLDRISALASEGRVREVVLSSDELPAADLMRAAQRCADLGLRARVVSTHFRGLAECLCLPHQDGRPVFVVGPGRISGARARIKRTLDIVGALSGLVGLSPLLAAIALLVKLTSPGPVLHRQIRVGQGGRRFTFYKFRSMVSAASDGPHREFVDAFVKRGAAGGVDAAGRPVFKLVRDPRVTPFGRFLRRTSLDELPQLVNVLRGEMSLVGPRPPLPYELEVHEDWQRRRLDVRPGCTGLWQVRGRSAVGFQDMVLLDLYYIANWTLGLDLALILRTVPVMLAARGGH